QSRKWAGGRNSCENGKLRGFVNRDLAACRGEPRANVPGHSYNSTNGRIDVRATIQPTDTGRPPERPPYSGHLSVQRVANAEFSADLAGPPDARVRHRLAAGGR